MNDKTDEKYYQVAKTESLATALMIQARRRIYSDFLANCQPQPEDKILDVGVSDIVREGTNLFEVEYPYPSSVTAAGLGDGKDFKSAFPEINYVRISSGDELPFCDEHFDISISNAVLEHVGSREKQKSFVSELMRVSKKIYITVPNRFFLVEHHTSIPFMHWSDSSFRLACRLMGKDEWAHSHNLLLMSRRSLLDCCREDAQVKCGYTGIALGPFSSNLFLMASKAN